MSRQKRQGTQEETWNVKFYGSSPGVERCRRIAEGGSADEGDVEIVTAAGRVVLESKATANLNPHQTLAKAIRKAGAGKDGVGVVLSHKRLVDKGGLRRVADGVARIVAMTPEFFRHLLEREAQAYLEGKQAGYEIGFDAGLKKARGQASHTWGGDL